MKLTDVKIGTRLVVAFATLLLVITAISGASVWRLRLIAYDTDQMEAASDNERVAQEWLRYTASNLVRTNAAARTTNAEDEKRFKDEIAATREQISQLQKRLEEVVDSGEGKLLMEKIAQRRKEYLAARDEVFKAKVPGMPEAAAAAAALIDDKLVPASKAYMASVEELSGHLKSEFMRTHDDLHALSANGQILLAGAWLVAVVLGTIFSWTLGRSITRPLKEAVQMAEAVAAGDLTTRVSYVSRDELGTLLHALGRMTESLLRIVNEVRSTTGSTVTAAREIATGNQDLSARTEQQASALEETASAMEELTSTVKQNADNANHANALASTASETAVKGGEVVTGVVQTMGSISDSSRKIVDIISVIDGIAFQTNILALNAAVEAARAGEQGRGFAVVAAEVRSLAQRSAGAAKEIKALIDDSVRKVEQGRELVDGAGQTMQEIVASVKRVTDVISEIAAASQEQTAGIEQINKAISQMDQVTQQNAALVEEAAAAAMSMQEQAVKLSHSVDVFKVESASATSGLALSSTPAVPIKEAPRRIAASQDWEEF